MANMSLGEDFNRRHIAGKTWAEIATEVGRTPEAVRCMAKRYRKATGTVLFDSTTHAPDVVTENIAPQFSDAGRTMPTLNEFVQLARMTQKVNDAVDPILTTQTITIDTDKPIAIVFASCWHLGSRYVNHEAFEKLLLGTLKVERLYWIDLGDQTEAFTGFFDVAAAHEQALADPKVQRAMLAEVLDIMIKEGKLLAGFAGQHGADWPNRKGGEDPVKRMYLERSIPYFDGQGAIRIEVGNQTYSMFGAHQLPGSSMWNPVHAQKRAGTFKAPNAEIIFQGDKHVGAVQHMTLPTWEVLTGDRKNADLWLVQSGTAKTGPDKYTIKNWSTGVWDWPILILRGDRHEIAEAKTLAIAKVLLQSQDW